MHESDGELAVRLGKELCADASEAERKTVSADAHRKESESEAKETILLLIRLIENTPSGGCRHKRGRTRVWILLRLAQCRENLRLLPLAEQVQVRLCEHHVAYLGALGGS